MSETCPKCGAKMDRHACLESPREMFVCDSYQSIYSKQFAQSDKCRIAELTQKNARLIKDRERLQAELDCFFSADGVHWLRNKVREACE